MTSSLCSFLSADSKSVVIINKTNFSYLLQSISVFYLQKHPHATVTRDNWSVLSITKKSCNMALSVDFL